MTRPQFRPSDAELRRELLQCGRQVGSPSPAALARTLSHLEAAAATGLFVTAVGTKTACAGTSVAGMGAASTVKAAASSLMVKWFVSGLTVGLVGGGAVGVVATSQSLWHPSVPPATVSVPRAQSAPHPPSHAARLPGNVSKSTPGSDGLVKSAPTDAASRRGTEARSNNAVPRQPPQDPASIELTESATAMLSPELARELSLLDRARSALARGDTPGALHWLTEHQREFPNGQLLPEAELLRLEVNAPTVRSEE